MFSSWFSKKDASPPVKNYVYATTVAKWQGVKELIALHPDSILIAWFPDTQKKFLQAAQQMGLTAPVVYMDKHVTSMKVAGKTVIFLEHYPMPEKETTLVQGWQTKEIFVVSSLDEPLLMHFGGERIAALMKQLGMKENEVIEHSLVTKSILNAQEKLAKKVMAEYSANSQEDWFRKNISYIH